MPMPRELVGREVPEKRPPNPYIVLALAILLPGSGHVVAGMPQRALVFVFFILLFG